MLCEGKSWPKQLLSDAVKRQTVSGRCQNGPFHLLVAEEHTRRFFCQSIFPLKRVVKVGILKVLSFETVLIGDMGLDSSVI